MNQHLACPPFFLMLYVAHLYDFGTLRAGYRANRSNRYLHLSKSMEDAFSDEINFNLIVESVLQGCPLHAH